MGEIVKRTNKGADNHYIAESLKKYHLSYQNFSMLRTSSSSREIIDGNRLLTNLQIHKHKVCTHDQICIHVQILHIICKICIHTQI